MRRRMLTLSKNGSDPPVPSDTVWPNKRGSYPREGVISSFPFYISSKLRNASTIRPRATYRPRAHLGLLPFSLWATELIYI